MKQDKDFTFEAMLSTRGYSSKWEANQSLSYGHFSKKMAFKHYSMTLDLFKEYIMNGYSYCNVFQPKAEEWVECKNYKTNNTYWKKQKTYYTSANAGINKDAMNIKFKADKYYSFSQVVSIDIDETRYNDIQEYIDKLTFQPSFTYTSFSDTSENRKFRMCYVFDSKLNGQDFDDVAKYLHAQAMLDTKEMVKDRCGVKRSQYFNGTNHDEYYITYNVYNKDEVFKIYNEKKEQRYGKASLTNIRDDKSNYNMSYIQGSDCKGEKKTVTFDEDLVRDMKKDDFKTVIKNHSKTYDYYYRSEKDEWITTEEGYKYQMTDENYIELYVPQTKVVDGQHRRKKIYERVALRRLMKPTVTPSQLLYNAYIDRNKHFDNTDGVLTIKTLQDAVISAFKKDIKDLEKEFEEKLKVARKNNPNFIVYSYSNIKNTAERKRMIKATRGKISRTGKSKYDMEQLLSLYNPEISERANIEEMKKQGIKVSKCKMHEVATLFKEKQSNTVVEADYADYTTTNIVIGEITERLKLPYGDNDLINIVNPLLVLLEQEKNQEIKDYVYSKVQILYNRWVSKGYSTIQCNVINKVAAKFYNAA